MTLTYQDIKVGAKYKVKPEFKSECGNCEEADYIVITKNNYSDIRYDGFKNGKTIDSCSCYDPEMLEPFAPTCFEELSEGDVVLNDEEEEKVLFANGLVVILEDEDGNSSIHSKKEFEEYGFTIPAQEDNQKKQELLAKAQELIDKATELKEEAETL